MAPAGDVNDDGYDDVVLGIPSYTGARPVAGRAEVYLGSASGLSLVPSWTADGTVFCQMLGTSVASAGDVNADGYDDVIVGGPGGDGGGVYPGEAFVYLGSASDLSPTPAWSAAGSEAQAKFGHSVASAGDVNADGFVDVVVGAPGQDGGGTLTDAGAAYVFLGSASGPATSPVSSFVGDQTAAALGFAVASAGDVSSDGYDDVLVGAPFYDAGTTDEGRAYLFEGAASGPEPAPAWTVESNNLGALLGSALLGSGDTNGDGFDDVLVGAPSFGPFLTQSNLGLALSYLGSSGGLDPTPISTQRGLIDSRLGTSLGLAGDTNGDGFEDVVVGAPTYENGQTSEGLVLVFPGGPGPVSSVLENEASWNGLGNQAGSRFGFDVSDAGDVDGDGYGDMIVGAPLYDNGQTNEGRAFVFVGSASGFSTTPEWMSESNQANAQFGSAVSGAGDVNGDGYDDVIVGAPLYDNSPTNEGRVFVHLGSPSGLSPIAAWTAQNSAVFSATFGEAVSSAGDVNGDGYADVIVGAPGAGGAYVYHGSPTGLAATPAWTVQVFGVQFGRAVSSAGDVNGDGYADVIAGAPGADNNGPSSGSAQVHGQRPFAGLVDAVTHSPATTNAA
ncbi:MAG: integrin alpha, partial [Actinobacteria bacterium]|nr:integrin alpha [Actinomycetota bacterium]